MECAALWNPVVAHCADWLAVNVPQFETLTEQCLAVLPIEAGATDSCDKHFFTLHANSLDALCGDTACSAACSETVTPLVARCGDSADTYSGVEAHLRPFADRCGATGSEEIVRATMTLRGRASSEPANVAAFLNSLATALSISPVAAWVTQVLGRSDHSSITVMIVADAATGGAQALAAQLEALIADPSALGGVIDGSKAPLLAVLHSATAAPTVCEQANPCPANAMCTSTSGAYQW